MDMFASHVFPDGITLDCKSLREIEPSPIELEELSTNDVCVHVLPKEVGGYLPSEIFIWIGENLAISLTASLLYDLLKQSIPPLISFLKSRLKKLRQNSDPCSNVMDTQLFLAFKGKSSHFAVDIPYDMDQEDLEKLLTLFVQTVDLIKHKE